ncbi:MAG TPA: hypothetical protein VH309_03755 [Elusimicrobiota bacterium]|nr:hypothetical protein [Elusimicrobiota bacterium]
MMIIVRRGTRSLAAGLGLLALLAWPAPRAAAAPRASPQAVIRAWPRRERAVARAMLEKYGRPAQFDRRQLVWFNKGIWKRTIVYRRSPRFSAKAPDAEFLQQTVGYIVPADKIAALERFDPRIEVSPTAGELGFISDSEGTNLLGLNVADEVVTGRRSVSDARAFFARTSRLAASGKSSPFLRKLLFPVDNKRYIAPTGADR